MDEIVIYGAGGFAREVAWLIEDEVEAGRMFARIACFVDDDQSKSGSRLNGISIKTFEEACKEHSRAVFTLAIGDPVARERLAAKVSSSGFEFVGLRHLTVRASRHNEIGNAAVICAGTLITTNVKIGNHVQINLDCTIGHDCELGDFVTLAPGVHVSGRVKIDKGAYLGTGAVVINGSEEKPLTIGEYAVVGAGASVIHDVEAGKTVVGVPARPIGGA